MDTFLHDLPRYSDLAPERVLFVVDGLRSSIYDPTKETKEARSFFALMRRYLIEKAVQAGYAVIDLHEVFRADYHKHGRRFEFDVDSHWSAYGHGVVAGAIMRSQWYSNVPKIE